MLILLSFILYAISVGGRVERTVSLCFVAIIEQIRHCISAY